jgi:ParB family chromosome partitioning protein
MEITEIKEISIEKIKISKDNPRKEFDAEKLKEMSETFKTQGTIQPIEIDEHYFIITGELRYRASKMAGRKTIPSKIIKGLTPNERLERQLVENFNRQDMKLVNSIDAVKKFMGGLKTDVKHFTSDGHGNQLMIETAKRLGVSRQWLYENLKLDKEAPEELKKAVKEEKMTVSQATEIMKAPKEDRVNITKSVLKEKEIPEYRKIREKVQVIKSASPEVKKAIFNNDIDIKQAESISKIPNKERREHAIGEFKALKVVQANVINRAKRYDDEKFKRELAKKLEKAQAWINGFKSENVATLRQLEKAIKVLLTAVSFIPVMDEKQKERLTDELEMFIEKCERGRQIAEQIMSKIEK